jgi:hypothetical protein
MVATERHVEEESKIEQTAAGRNGQGNQDTGVSDDVTTRREPDWTVVAGRTRAHKRALTTTQMSTMPIVDESMSGTKTKRKNGSRAYSFV